MSDCPTIRPAAVEDAEALDLALQRLSAELQDPHSVDSSDIASAAFGENPVFHVLIAQEGTGIDGFTFLSPIFSSVRGGPGTFISDLWVAPDRRGGGLGRLLLAAASDFGKQQWSARFLKLSVYDRSFESQAFYARMGFSGADHEKVLYLTEDGFHRLTASA